MYTLIYKYTIVYRSFTGQPGYEYDEHCTKNGTNQGPGFRSPHVADLDGFNPRTFPHSA